MRTGIKAFGEDVEIFVVHAKPEDLNYGDPRTTTATVKIGTDEYTCQSICAKTDMFNRHEGSKRALARAMKSSGIGKPTRKALWSKFFNGKYDTITATKYIGPVESTPPYKRINTDKLEFRIWQNEATAHV